VKQSVNYMIIAKIHALLTFSQWVYIHIFSI